MSRRSCNRDRRSGRIYVALAALLTAAAAGSPAVAQYSSSGYFLRPHLVGAAWSIEDIDEEDHSGSGFGIGAGYGLTEWIALIADLSVASLETENGNSYALAHFDLGVQVTVTRPDARLKVFLDAAASARTARFEIFGGEVDLNGKGGTLGFGLMYFMSESWALDGSLMAMFGNIDEISGGGASLDLEDVRANSARINFGLAWYPGR